MSISCANREAKSNLMQKVSLDFQICWSGFSRSKLVNVTTSADNLPYRDLIRMKLKLKYKTPVQTENFPLSFWLFQFLHRFC